MFKQKVLQRTNNSKGIFIFLVSLVVIEVLYFLGFFNPGLFRHYGYEIDGLTTIIHPFILAFLIGILTLCQGLILFGFIFKRQWTRKFTMFFIIWASVWPIWGILVNNMITVHVCLCVIYFLMIVYLMTQTVKDYFRSIAIINGYTLYKRDVLLKSGKKVIIHFFSKKTPKSGHPTYIPKNHEVRYNIKSGMPYLIKVNPYAFRYGAYTLYKKIVVLKNGISIPIYFFAKNKPKSGKPVSLPEKYIVKENDKSHMPYLTKKGIYHS